MKNKYSKLIILLILSFTVVCCLQENALAAVDAVASESPIKSTVMKFLMAMGGVVASSLILFVGLTVYNRIRGKKYQIKETVKSPSQFETPKTVDDSINLFINQNKL